MSVDYIAMGQNARLIRNLQALEAELAQTRQELQNALERAENAEARAKRAESETAQEKHWRLGYDALATAQCHTIKMMLDTGQVLSRDQYKDAIQHVMKTKLSRIGETYPHFSTETQIKNQIEVDFEWLKEEEARYHLYFKPSSS